MHLFEVFWKHLAHSFMNYYHAFVFWWKLCCFLVILVSLSCLSPCELQLFNDRELKVTYVLLFIHGICTLGNKGSLGRELRAACRNKHVTMRPLLDATQNYLTWYVPILNSKDFVNITDNNTLLIFFYLFFIFFNRCIFTFSAGSVAEILLDNQPLVIVAAGQSVVISLASLRAELSQWSVKNRSLRTED